VRNARVKVCFGWGCKPRRGESDAVMGRTGQAVIPHGRFGRKKKSRAGIDEPREKERGNQNGLDTGWGKGFLIL